MWLIVKTVNSEYIFYHTQDIQIPHKLGIAQPKVGFWLTIQFIPGLPLPTA